MINLYTISDKIEDWMNASISTFLATNPEQSVSEIGLYSSPVNGWVSLCLETCPLEKSPKTSCPDFSHPEYALLEFPNWQDDYENPIVIIKRHDSRVIRFEHSQGDEEFNRHFFDFLMRVINDRYHAKNQVYRPTWAGVQILDSRYWSFGRIYQPNRL